MKKVLINLAHPAKSRSKINMALRNRVEDLEHVTVNDLYVHYPDFLIDVSREQQLVKATTSLFFSTRSTGAPHRQLSKNGLT